MTPFHIGDRVHLADTPTRTGVIDDYDPHDAIAAVTFDDQPHHWYRDYLLEAEL